MYTDIYQNASSYFATQVYARDSIKDRLTPNTTQRNTLIVGASYIVIIGILWYGA
jgi:hypothetical protein